MKETFKLILAFAPWLAFWFISGPSMLRLQIAIFVAIALVIVMAITKLHRGVILWAGYAFFAFALIFVIWLKNMWVIRHLAILAPGTLFVAAQLSVLFGRPFTGDYARENVPKEILDSAAFVRGCFITSSFWASIFLVNSLLNVVKFSYHDIPEWRFSVTEYAMILVGIIFTNMFSKTAKKKRMAMQGAAPQSNT
ncbi:MAG: hypothetical protein NTX75_00510 [Proteobacteria bacterium]|nr:hypothetical protein [Pseudomonadota bacterium]